MSASTPKANESPMFTIGVFARLTGINPGTLRIWERRYKIANPTRSGPGDKRLYSQSDVDRLALVKALVDGGHPVSSLAHLTIEDLRSRLKASAVDRVAGTPAFAHPCRVLVVGDSLAIRLQDHKGQLPGVEIVGTFRHATDLDDNTRALAPDVLVVEYPTLQRETHVEVRRLVAASGARHAIVTFGFGAGRTLQDLERAGVPCLRAPVSLPEIVRACASVRGRPDVRVQEDNAARGDSIAPPRRFSAEQLARIASSATPVKCECPHHLVDLVTSLVAFEKYSSECANLYPHDAEIHALLHTTTAAARALLETALARVIEAEGIEVN
jgi:DNA-binding transcriptional MerR regulator